MICHIRLFLRINEHFYCEKEIAAAVQDEREAEQE